MRQSKVSILGAIQKNYIVLTGDATLELNKRYITDSSSRLKLTLPATSIIGDLIEIVGKGTGGWEIYSNASSATVLGYSNTNLGAWTASGVKSFAGQFFYEID